MSSKQDQILDCFKRLTILSTESDGKLSNHSHSSWGKPQIDAKEKFEAMFPDGYFDDCLKNREFFQSISSQLTKRLNTAYSEKGLKDILKFAETVWDEEHKDA